MMTLDSVYLTAGVRAGKRMYLIIECGRRCIAVEKHIEELAATEGEGGKRLDGTMDIHQCIWKFPTSPQ
jgi:hypothetical protein